MDAPKLKKSVLSAVAFFWTLCIMTVGYGAYTELATVTPWTPLSVSMWHSIKENFIDHEMRISNLSTQISWITGANGAHWSEVSWGIAYSSGHVGIAKYLGIGKNNPSSAINILGNGGGADDVLIDSYGTQEGTIMFRTGNGSPDSPLALTSGRSIGFMAFRWFDGSWFREIWRIQGVSETPITTTSWAGYLRFMTRGDAGTLTENMRITWSWSVGIGVANPVEKLEVSWGIKHSWPLYSFWPTYSTRWMYFDEHQYGNSLILWGGWLAVLWSWESQTKVPDNVTMDSEILYLTSDNGIEFKTKMQDGWSTKVDAMSIITNGNVGIWNVAPTYKLHVNGSVAGTSWTATSDARLKKNVKTLGGSLEKVSNMRGVSFEWDGKNDANTQYPEGKQIGFIAQEVEAVFPELINEDGKWFKGVEYANVTAILIEAVKELKIRNETLENRVKELESK